MHIYIYYKEMKARITNPSVARYLSEKLEPYKDGYKVGSHAFFMVCRLYEGERR